MTESLQTIPAADPPTPREPRVAVVLTFLLPGLGHLYSGVPRRALFLFLLSLLFGVASVAALKILSAWILPPAFALVGDILAGVLFLSLVARDAALHARRAGTAYVLRRYNRWYVYTALFLAVAFLVEPGYLRLLHNFLQAYRIPSTSMEPTILLGDHIFATPLRRPPLRGQIVIYSRRKLFVVKRVVGTPGDTLAMQAAVLSVNGHAVSEPYTSHAQERSDFDAEFLWQRRFLAGKVDTSAYHPTATFWGPIVVPPGNYFVLGDNRPESADSRHWGFVAAESVVQRPTFVYFSWDPQTYSVRWSRIGKRFDPP
jgi:signal peptidase I